ncbi:hypothetical protein HYU09_03230 [Candidatus Woesearchaeota archaeon]|nr:hypothetical protein [Candidatus Woesearchaeota archaeon]
MLKDKKSVLAVPEALLRIIITIAIVFLIVLPFWNRLEAAIFNPDRKYLESFENFASSINNMGQGRETLLLTMRDKSAIIGFSKDAGRYECFNCYVGIQNRPTVFFDRPSNPECSGRSCICLCNNLILYDAVENDKSIKSGKCSEIQCKVLNGDVPQTTPIKLYPGIDIWVTTIGGGTEYWKNGFLYARGVSGANGLKLYTDESVNFVAERRGSNIGICNYDLLGFNQGTLGIDRCVITAFDEAKKLEEKNIDKAIEKYTEIISSGQNTEDAKASMQRLVQIYMLKKQQQKVSEAYNQMISIFPELKSDAIEKQIASLQTAK